MRDWDGELAEYEATFDDEPPVGDKLAALDRLARAQSEATRAWTAVEWVVAGVAAACLAAYYLVVLRCV